MPGPASPLRTPLRRAALIAVLLSLVACSSSSKNTVSASDAAETVGAIFELPADQQSCLEQHFSDSATARKVFAGQGVASGDEVDALAGVEKACIPIETLAAAVTNGASDALGGAMTDEQRTCLTDGVTSLDDGDRRELLVGLAISNSDALDEAGLAEVGKITNGLLQLCHLDDATTQTTDGTAPPG